MIQAKSIKFAVTIALLGIFSPMALAQVSFSTLADLPSVFNEISGIETADSGHFYAMNDGGNQSAIYRVDTNGKVRATYMIQETNNDWEDLTASDEYLFIGDFGNNGNNRKNLRILRVRKDELSVSQSVKPTLIEFIYVDQKAFPPPSTHLNFDCEAFAYAQDSIYLFTKNRTSPYDGWCYLYVIPAKEGKHVAMKRDSFQIPALRKELGWITAADISETQILLLSSAFAIAFNRQGRVDFSGGSKRLDFGHFSQKEGLCIINDSIFYACDEKFTGLGGPRLFMGEWNFRVLGLPQFESETDMYVHGDYLYYHSCEHRYVKLEIYSLNGQLRYRKKLQKGNANVSIKSLKNGTYFAIIESDRGYRTVTRFVRREANE